MNTLTISVALPVYNGADYLREALDSILAQDFTDFELVVSDNCSTDETPEILAEYASRDRRVRVSRADSFLEQADNVSRSVELCTASWVKLFCHDDIMLLNCLSTLHEIITHDVTDRVGLIGDAPAWIFTNGYRRTVFTDNSIEPRVWDGQICAKDKLTAQNHTPPLPALTTATVRRDAFLSSSRFDRRFKHFDVFYWMQLLMRWDYLFISQPLTLTRIHSAQVHVETRKKLISIYDHRLFLREFVHEFDSELNLNMQNRLRIQLRPISIAGAAITIQLMRKRYYEGLEIIPQLPITWWLLLPFVVLRSCKQERSRYQAIASHVPINLVYP